MSQLSVINFLSYLEPLLCAALIIFLVRSGVSRSFRYLTAFLSVRILSDVAGMSLFHFCGHGIEEHLAYRLYFYVYWSSFALEAVLSLLIIYSIFKLSMAPLKGLQTLGILIFRWVAAISVAVSVGVAVAPHLSGSGFIVALVTQLQQTSSILTLCLLLFVCFAIRPMGLSLRSRVFGVSLGLGLMATVSLVDAAWISHNFVMQSTISVINGVAMCITLCIWSAYFAYPEPKRRLIVLPTTSPFLRWNQISLALGDEPGYVAIGGIAPELFAPAEIEIMKRASAMMPSKIETQSNLRSISA